MVVLPAGKFMMGSPDSDERKSRNERYQRLVTIALPFAIGLYPVMFREYHFCKCTNRQKPPDSDFGRDRRPVIHVSWLEARAYVRWLSDVTGQAYCLPSEAEWEYVCRAGTTTRYSVGDEITAKSANYSSKVSRTTEVGAYAPNPWGVFDMHGNVWEWVEDIWHDSYGYGDAPADGSAWNDGERENSPLHRVTRGGSWITRATFLRSAHRSGMAPHESTPDCGVRVARTLD